jgi:hypothetical protein
MGHLAALEIFDLSAVLVMPPSAEFRAVSEVILDGFRFATVQEFSREVHADTHHMEIPTLLRRCDRSGQMSLCWFNISILELKVSQDLMADVATMFTGPGIVGLVQKLLSQSARFLELVRLKRASGGA